MNGHRRSPSPQSPQESSPSSRSSTATSFFHPGATTQPSRSRLKPSQSRSDSFAATTSFLSASSEPIELPAPPMYANGRISLTPSARAALLTVEQTIGEQNTSLDRGLSSSEAEYRLKLHGPNDLEHGDGETLFGKFMEQIKNPMILLLLSSALISVLMGQYDDAMSITLAISIVVTVAFVQEYRSEKSLEELNRLVPHYCHLLREGGWTTQLANTLVPGDIVQFATGDRVPADVRLCNAFELEVDESSLTGENEPCRKTSEAIGGMANGANLPLAERKNIGFMGTLVRSGRGSGVVIGTGQQTEFGHVFNLMKEVDARKTPLQTKMDDLGKQLSALSFAIIVLIVIVGVLQGRQWLEMFTIGVSLAVAAIPEGLPIVVTVTLALGVLRMAKRQVIVKKLPSVESLGSVNVICVDKTGTLTMNKMTAVTLYVAANDTFHELEEQPVVQLYPALITLLRAGNLCNNAELNIELGHAIGQPTEVALLELCQRFCLKDERKSSVRITEQPFTFDTKWMSVTCQIEDTTLTFAKGALERILERCNSVLLTDGTSRPMDSAARERIEARAAHATKSGLRLISMAVGTKADSDWSFVGFCGLIDPPRPGIGRVINTLIEGGVKVVMITGDSEGTALSIASRLGIASQATSGYHLSGSDMDVMSEHTLTRMIHDVSIFYRATPKHKMQIVRAFQAKGDIVAMTGDGVNDAPALKLADIGVAMGRGGTDVAKEAADMILVEDDFSTVLHAIEEGKSIFYNIQNFLRFQLSTAISALALIAMATFLGLSNPLNAMQILWINIICDGPVAQSLGVEAVDPDVMRAPPRNPNTPIVSRRLISRILTSAFMMVAGTLWVFQGELKHGSVSARGTTVTFTSFVFFDLFNSMACRSERRSIFEIGLFTNSMYNGAFVFSLVGQLLVVYLPVFQAIFQTEALPLLDLLQIVLVASTVLWVDEIRKYLEKTKSRFINRTSFGKNQESIV
ncbi:calcium-transporting ATPase 1 [Gonapodya prolifera JEL478]|uniref:Calcium-transporting ATPase n=1 Tax=Gonapodya prolifera (strain JEL478) TaxID=1344416 RepID=A0A139AUJ2_GONPJ|nr:calcium-transporting ATPase 1 [Gonapodya prolifera JEL478]|eukprot:KXS20410.1 calcium-transporting ATPase 1 [Gonapodya prolifera JEL478]